VTVSENPLCKWDNGGHTRKHVEGGELCGSDGGDSIDRATLAPIFGPLTDDIHGWRTKTVPLVMANLKKKTLDMLVFQIGEWKKDEYEKSE
jgi:hypothetical protein